MNPAIYDFLAGLIGDFVEQAALGHTVCLFSLLTVSPLMICQLIVSVLHTYKNLGEFQ
ncbi:Hypothetical protein FKW44_018036, partial [Caligus rogercresseyi]